MMRMIAHVAALFAGYKHGAPDEIKSESMAGEGDRSGRPYMPFHKTI